MGSNSPTLIYIYWFLFGYLKKIRKFATEKCSITIENGKNFMKGFLEKVL